MSKVVSPDITRRGFAASLSAIAGAGAVAGSAAAAAMTIPLVVEPAPDAWAAYTMADLDAMHEALSMADDGLMAIYNQPRTDVEGPAGAFIFGQAEAIRRTLCEITSAVRARKAETEADLDTQWRIIARTATTVENYDMEGELVALLMARRELARRRGAPGA